MPHWAALEDSGRLGSPFTGANGTVTFLLFIFVSLLLSLYLEPPSSKVSPGVLEHFTGTQRGQVVVIYLK